MDDLDSVKLALAAEQHNHRSDNEFLLARAVSAEAEVERLRAQLRSEVSIANGLALQFHSDDPDTVKGLGAKIEALLSRAESAERHLAEYRGALEQIASSTPDELDLSHSDGGWDAGVVARRVLDSLTD